MQHCFSCHAVRDWLWYKVPVPETVSFPLCSGALNRPFLSVLSDCATHCRTVNLFILNGTKRKRNINVILSHTVRGITLLTSFILFPFCFYGRIGFFLYCSLWTVQYFHWFYIGFVCVCVLVPDHTCSPIYFPFCVDTPPQCALDVHSTFVPFNRSLFVWWNIGQCKSTSLTAFEMEWTSPTGYGTTGSISSAMYVIPNIEPLKEYTITVSLINKCGKGTISEPITCRLCFYHCVHS